MGEPALQWWHVVRRLVTPVVVAVVLLPAVTGDDSFPVSTYPMYAFVRSRSERFATVLGESATGGSAPLPIRVVADTDDPLIAAALVRTAIRNGSADQLCEQVAARVGDEVERVLVVEEVHDVVARAAGAPSLKERVVHATCEVDR
jgi:hypothetical protein